MSTQRGRNVALAISIAGLAAAGCGSSSTTVSAPATPSVSSTTSAAVGQIETAIAPVIAAFKAVQANQQSAKRSSTWSGLAAKMQASVVSLKGITVSTSDKSKYQETLSLLGAMASDARQIATAIAHHNRAAANAGVQKFKQDAQKLAAL